MDFDLNRAVTLKTLHRLLSRELESPFKYMVVVPQVTTIDGSVILHA